MKNMITNRDMHVLENSPIDTLAFNYSTFLNNLWTWFALIFWKIRTPKPELLSISNDPSSDKPDPVHELLESLQNDDVNPARVPTTTSNSVDGVTKGKIKFTSYYYYEDDVDDDNDRDCVSHQTLTELEERERGFGLEWWEKLLRTKTGENEKGWYTCQDLTMLNGNVVRFWDGGFGFATFENGGIKY